MENVAANVPDDIDGLIELHVPDKYELANNTSYNVIPSLVDSATRKY
jgi:hypothetical protein